MAYQPIPAGRFPLVADDNLFYARDGIEGQRTPEAILALSKKFERSFADAWGIIWHRDRRILLDRWEESGGTFGFNPSIEMLNGWASYDQSKGVTLWQVEQGGQALRFWMPVIEAMPREAIISLILEALSYAFVRLEGETKVDISYAAYRVRTHRWMHPGEPLSNWHDSEPGRVFASEWRMTFKLLSDEDLDLSP